MITIASCPSIPVLVYIPDILTYRVRISFYDSMNNEVYTEVLK